MCFFSFWGYARGLAACSAGLLYFSYFGPWHHVTTSPTVRLGDYVGTLHLVVSVFALFWKTSCLLKLKKTISLSRGRTLSGHTWSTSKKFSILNLSSLHPYGKPYLGYTAQRWFTLLDDGSCCSATVCTARRQFMLLDNCSQLLNNSSRWSDHEFDYSALFVPTQTSSR